VQGINVSVVEQVELRKQHIRTQRGEAKIIQSIDNQFKLFQAEPDLQQDMFKQQEIQLEPGDIVGQIGIDEQLQARVEHGADEDEQVDDSDGFQGD
jgi:hypothetical protein